VGRARVGPQDDDLAVGLFQHLPQLTAELFVRDRLVVEDESAIGGEEDRDFLDLALRGGTGLRQLVVALDSGSWSLRPDDSRKVVETAKKITRRKMTSTSGAISMLMRSWPALRNCTAYSAGAGCCSGAGSSALTAAAGTGP